MKKNHWIWLFMGIFLVSSTIPLMAADTGNDTKKEDPGKKAWKNAVDYGRELFHGTKLGTNGKSCANPSCHENGANLEGVISDYPKYVEMANRVVTLGHMVNFCIYGAVKGKMLDLDSTKLIALQAYIKSLEEKK